MAVLTINKREQLATGGPVLFTNSAYLGYDKSGAFIKKNDTVIVVIEEESKGKKTKIGAEGKALSSYGQGKLSVDFTKFYGQLMIITCTDINLEKKVTV